MALAKRIKSCSDDPNPVCQNPTCTNETKWFRSSGRPKKYCCTKCGNDAKLKTGKRFSPVTGNCRVCGLALGERDRGLRGPARRTCRDCRRSRAYLKVEKRCAFCDVPFLGQRRSRCCSPRCGTALHYEALGRRAGGSATCIQCGTQFKQQSVDRKHCSRKCANKTSTAKAKAGAARATCKHCGKDFQPKRGRYNTFCSRACCFAYVKANIGTEANKKIGRQNCRRQVLARRTDCPSVFKKWEQRAARRARENGVYRESISIAGIVARDGSDCHICGVPIDFSVRVPAAKAPTMDHLIPQGTWRGAHVMDNLKLAHFACNSIRSDRKITAKLVKQCRAKIAGKAEHMKTVKRPATRQKRLF